MLVDPGAMTLTWNWSESVSITGVVLVSTNNLWVMENECVLKGGLSMVTVIENGSINQVIVNLTSMIFPYWILELETGVTIVGRNSLLLGSKYGGENASKLSSVGYNTLVKLFNLWGLLPPTKILPSRNKIAVEWYILGIWPEFWISNLDPNTLSGW